MDSQRYAARIRGYVLAYPAGSMAKQSASDPVRESAMFETKIMIVGSVITYLLIYFIVVGDKNFKD